MVPGVLWGAKLRTTAPGPRYPANNLRKRLLDQTRVNGRNAHLAARLCAGGVQVRWTVVRENWRDEERRIYELFIEAFGAPPECNRMSP